MKIFVEVDAPRNLSNRQQGMILPWLAGYTAAWWASVHRILDLYAELPTEPPVRCYIATAAARGHPALVKSVPVRFENGKVTRINPQLRTLKCGELALKVIAPKTHKTMRYLYDRLGKWLAGKITHPLAADAAYLILKPFEWVTYFGLRAILPDFDAINSILDADEVE